MGKIYDKVVSSTITNAAQIACVVPTDHLLVCSVSNWGGYALAAAATTVCALQRAGSGARALFPVCDVPREWGSERQKTLCRGCMEMCHHKLVLSPLQTCKSSCCVPLTEPLTRGELLQQLAVCVPSAEEESAKCQSIVDAGARDGVTGKLEPYVDGMPIATSLEVLRKLRELDLEEKKE
jgi:hypothetical protein